VEVAKFDCQKITEFIRGAGRGAGTGINIKGKMEVNVAGLDNNEWTGKQAELWRIEEKVI